MSDRKHSLLVVDDSPNWRELLSLIFESKYEVTTAESYQQALFLLDEHRVSFDVALIDIRLVDTEPQNEDGLRLVRYIRESGLKTRAIVLTGYPDIRTSKIALRDLGVHEYLEKYPAKSGGLDIDELRQAVQTAVGEYRALLIEDDPRWREMLAGILIEDGYSVDQVSTSAEARMRLSTGSYPVAIVDLKLGDATPDQGIELLEYAGRLNLRPRLVVISGYGNKERVRDAFERGHATAFIFKDQFDPAHFRDRVRWAMVG